MTVAGREGQGATDTASERMGQTVDASPIAASFERKGVTVAGFAGQSATDTASERMGQTVDASPIAASTPRRSPPA